MLIKATRKSRGFSLQMFKFIADSGDTLNIVWKIRFKAQFLTQLTYMIMNRFSRIEITILFPNQIGNHPRQPTMVRQAALSQQYER